MEELKIKFQEKLLSAQREGMENVIRHLERLGFFDAPASTRFHLNVKGGLMLHSWNVCNTALMLLALGLKLTKDEMLAIRWHMTAWDLPFLSSEQKANLQMAREQAPLCTVIQCADSLSTSLLED